MQKNENSLQPDNLQEIAAAQLSNPQAGEGKEDEIHHAALAEQGASSA